MNESAIIPYVELLRGEVKTTSLKVAEHFGKQHKHVIRDIEKIIAQTIDLSNAPKFGLIEVEVKVGFGVRKEKAYEFGKDAFVLLVMGYSGEKAMPIKINYIAAFNAMAAELSKPQYGLKQLTTPKTKKALPGGLMLEQQDCIKALIAERIDQLPKDKQGGAAMRLWSSISTHFGTQGQKDGYKNIPADQFSAVCSLIARVELKHDPVLRVTPLELDALVDQRVKKALEGEVIFKEKDCPKYHYPISDWQPKNRVGQSA